MAVISWESSFQGALEKSKRAVKPLLVDFFSPT
jgi:hypothetical protein